MSRKYTKEDADRFHDYDINIGLRIVSLFSVHTEIDGEESGVDSALAERAIKNLTLLEGINKDPITIILNTPGGDWYSGIAIYDTIRACKSHVTIMGAGQVMSMGSVILQSADKRLLYPNTKVMIHYGHSGYSGHAKTHQKWAEEFKKLDLKMEEILMDKIKDKHPNFDLRTLRNMLDHDTILSAREAVDLGLADGIIGEDEVASG